MPFFFGGGPRRGPGGPGFGFGRPMRRRGFWGPPPAQMGYYPRRRWYNNGGYRNSLWGGLALGALGYAAGKFFGGRGGNGGFGGPGPGPNTGGGADWGGGNSGSSGSFDAGGGGDWN